MKVKTLAASAIVLSTMQLMTAPSASALQTPKWRITSVSTPTDVKAGDEQDEVIVSAVNVGGAATDGSAVTITESLPAGITAGSARGTDEFAELPLACSTETRATVSCTDSATVDPGDELLVRVPIQIAPNAATSDDESSVVGGGAEGTASVGAIIVSSTQAEFGLVRGGTAIALSSMEAGGHPNLTTLFSLNTREFAEVPAESKDVEFNAPVGLVGDAVGFPRCPINSVLNGGNGGVPLCPADTVVGTAIVTITSASLLGRDLPFSVPVYNVAPAPGEPVAFAFKAQIVNVRLDTSVLSDGDYGVRVTAANISEGAQTLAASVTVWGVPAEHNGAGRDHVGRPEPLGGIDVGAARVPLLTNPTQCATPLTATLATDSWQEPGTFQTQETELGLLTGCDKVPFTSSMSMVPDKLEAGAPAGYDFDLTIDRAQDAAPEEMAASDVKDVTALLPVGAVISPSAATGLAACLDEQFFGPEANRGLSQPATAGACPPESQIGTVRIKTPALEEALQGNVYLGAPVCNPCTPSDAQSGRMVRLFVQATSEGEGGIVIKLEGTASINQQSGQITATFKDNPQLPFNEFKLKLSGGPRATLANPSVCGPTTTSADLTPWSTPFTLDSVPTSTFDVTGCQPPQFDPSFTAGTTNNQAGAFSPFTVSFGRGDADQDLAGIQMQLPPGLLGMVSSVPLCREPQATEGTCGPESAIGSTQVLTGPGSEPFLVTGGQVFLTEGYKGAPYGLSIVVPAKAGPYTLSGTTGTGLVVVRAAINVSSSTAALIITSDPLPTILDGIPLALKVVNVTINRPGFTFNPTSCTKTVIGATLASTEGASAADTSSFQVTNCAALAFKPAFAVSTSAKTSKADGASLDAKVTYPPGSQGTEANIARVQVDLPKQLPPRLTTLQKACTAAVFEADPADCPAASVIGVAKASTPVLPVMLTGPVYFVSHGGEAFPSLVMILQGDGVRVDLIGATFINNAGITSSTFKSVPDVPISSFELYLPEGRYSALAANLPAKDKNSFCRQKLTMPTAFVAQDGAETHESTPIAVAGCARAKVKKRRAKKKNPRQAGQTRSARGTK